MGEIARAELLKEIECRMRANGIFYQDIWEKILLTDTPVLREIAESKFEEEVLRMKGEN